MNWNVSKTGGWVEVVEEGKRKTSVSNIPQLPDEIVLYIYKLSRGLLKRDIQMRGVHPLFNTFRGVGFSAKKGSYSHIIKRNVDMCSETTNCENLDERKLVATSNYFILIKSIRILIKKEFNWLQSSVNMLQNERVQCFSEILS